MNGNIGRVIKSPSGDTKVSISDTETWEKNKKFTVSMGRSYKV